LSALAGDGECLLFTSWEIFVPYLYYFFKRIGFMATLRPLMAIYPAQMETTTSQDSNNNMASHRKYRMVALDLDGTLLNSKHELSDVTVDYLRSLNERGFVVAIATGR
jgi:hypothetical protein